MTKLVIAGGLPCSGMNAAAKHISDLNISDRSNVCPDILSGLSIYT